MNNVFGITGIQTKVFEVNKNDVSEVNAFLKEYDGDIIDIQIIPMFQGFSRWAIIYREKENSDMGIANAIAVPTAGGCYMYYGWLNNGNWFFVTDSWDYGYVLNVSPEEFMWDEDFENKINDNIIYVLEEGSKEFDAFYNSVLNWLDQRKAW